MRAASKFFSIPVVEIRVHRLCLALDTGRNHGNLIRDNTPSTVSPSCVSKSKHHAKLFNIDHYLNLFRVVHEK